MMAESLPWLNPSGIPGAPVYFLVIFLRTNKVLDADMRCC